MAKVNPFRFSTKYQDDETDLLYYGYRYYNASTGRWLSRDPIGENGGDNIYVFIGNNSISHLDYMGLEFIDYGQTYNFGMMGAKGATYSKFDFELVAACRRCVCVFILEKFLVTTKTKIAVYDVTSIEAKAPYKPYTAAEIKSNSVHEAAHRNHAKQWYNAAFDGIRNDMSTANNYSCGECARRASEVKTKWKSSWNAFYANELNHAGPEWSDADKTPTNGEVNQDPATWLWTMPGDNLDQEIENPYAN